MTEIPEHLLKRSRERRAALGLGGDAPAEGAGAETPAAPAAATPAPTPAAAPARAAAPVEEPKPEPPKPDPVYVTAAKNRRRVPFWAMPVLVAMPLWGYIYVRTLEPPPAGETDPFVLGSEVYTACSSCHGATGGGGAGPAFADGAVQESWPDWRDHMMWVRVGSEGWPGETYGAIDKAKQGGMPAWPTLSDQELAQVVLHERTLGGEEIAEDDEEYADLFAIAAGEMTFADAGLGPESEAAGVPEDELGG